MPASYVHQCVAGDACNSLSLFEDASERAALLCGSEGPDPFFFSFFSLPGVIAAPQLGSILHTRKTDDFLLALCDAAKDHPLTRAYACGFFAHYATDTTFHPFVYAHSLSADGAYSGTLHCTLEHQLETLHHRRLGHKRGLPHQMHGFTALSSAQRFEIAKALSAAIVRVFPEYTMKPQRIARAFDDAAALCSLLRSESGKKYRILGSLLHPMHLDAALHAHMMPAEPPQADIANDAHRAWASIWTPDLVRYESFSDLYAMAISRTSSLIEAANGYMAGNVSYATLRALHGGNSYDSGLSWQTTCAASSAPGVKKK